MHPKLGGGVLGLGAGDFFLEAFPELEKAAGGEWAELRVFRAFVEDQADACAVKCGAECGE
jgi:hypothetical protein